jgi:hypothetical protein
MASRNRDCDMVCDVCSGDTFDGVTLSDLTELGRSNYVANYIKCYVCTSILCDTCTLICGGDCKDKAKFICKPCYFQRYNRGIKPVEHYTGVIWMCNDCANDPNILPITVECDDVHLNVAPVGKTLKYPNSH